jgi:GNAT superfamily N-acetyltransferase
VVRQLSAVQEIEEALVGHWSHFGRWPRGALVEERGTLRYETPIAQLPYNGVIRTRIVGDPDSVIESVLAGFARRDVSCAWWHHPTASPPDLGERLAARGLELVEEAVGMSLDLRDRPRQRVEQNGVRYLEVLDEGLLRHYSELIFRYWEVDERSHSLVEEANAYWDPGRTPVTRWVALDETGNAIGKALLSRAAPPGVAAIYGMSVTPEARGRGVASALTGILLERAERLGCERVVLHSSEMAIGVYERAGFVRKCELPVYANATLWASRGN